MKKRVLPDIVAGEKISALAITEPSGGSDVAALKTTARLDGNEYVVNGSKMFITSGMRADYYSVAVRTGGPGAAGVSLLLIENQVIRHKLVDMRMKIETARAYLYDCAYQVREADLAVTSNTSPDMAQIAARMAMLKNCATQAMQFCADQAVQILGGAGFMRGSRVERIYREVKVMMIGGGSEEIMKDLAAKQLGF